MLPECPNVDRLVLALAADHSRHYRERAIPQGFEDGNSVHVDAVAPGARPAHAITQRLEFQREFQFIIRHGRSSAIEDFQTKRADHQ